MCESVKCLKACLLNISITDMLALTCPFIKPKSCFYISADPKSSTQGSLLSGKLLSFEHFPTRCGTFLWQILQSPWDSAAITVPSFIQEELLMLPLQTKLKTHPLPQTKQVQCGYLHLIKHVLCTSCLKFPSCICAPAPLSHSAVTPSES